MSNVIRVMVDLETLGQVPGCAILSIGATTFDHEASGSSSLMVSERRRFHQLIVAASNDRYGLKADPETVKWWESQPAEVRAMTYDICTDPKFAIRLRRQSAADPLELPDALMEFSRFINNLQDTYNCGVEVWGNGASFDIAILNVAYAAIQQPKPWHYRKERCYRTLHYLFPQIEAGPWPEFLTKHRAVDDAIYQALHAEMILDHIRRVDVRRPSESTL